MQRFTKIIHAKYIQVKHSQKLGYCKGRRVVLVTVGVLHSSVIKALVFVAFVEDNANMSSIRYFENRVSQFV